MRYMMKARALRLGDDFTIKGEAGRDVYFVDGKVSILASTVVIDAPATRTESR